MKLEFEHLQKVLGVMFKALPTTISLSIVILLISLTIAIILALLEYWEVKGVQKFIKVYTSFFRGTPLVAQLFFFYFGLPSLFPVFTNVNGYVSATITMSLNNSAYIKEAIRGALLSVDNGQIEAGKSLCYTNNQITRYIVFPQAIRVAIPSLANSFIDIIKGSSMAFTVGVIEITAAAQIYSASTLHFFEGYGALIVMYWLLIILLEKLLRVFEKKVNSKFE